MPSDRSYLFTEMNQSVKNVVAETAVMTSVPIVPSSEPVWLADEQSEEAERSRRGESRVPLMTAEGADDALAMVDVRLPDVLLPQAVESPAATAPLLPGDLAGFTPYLIRVPTSFDAPEGLTLRRLRLRLWFADTDGSPPVTLWLEPGSAVSVKTTQIAEVGADLASALKLLFPQIADVLTLKVHGQASVTTVDPGIQASGALTGECGWRVADAVVAYGFTPSVIVGVPGSGLQVDAELHVEVRKRVLGVFHRTYGKSASPRKYRFLTDGGKLRGIRRVKTERRPPGSLSAAELAKELDRLKRRSP